MRRKQNIPKQAPHAWGLLIPEHRAEAQEKSRSAFNNIKKSLNIAIKKTPSGVAMERQRDVEDIEAAESPAGT